MLHVTIIIGLVFFKKKLNLGSVIDKYQAGVLSTSCGSLNVAISDWTLNLCAGILSRCVPSWLLQVCTVSHSVGFSAAVNIFLSMNTNDANVTRWIFVAVLLHVWVLHDKKVADITDTTVMYTPQIDYRLDRRVHDGSVCYGHVRHVRSTDAWRSQDGDTHQPNYYY